MNPAITNAKFLPPLFFLGFFSGLPLALTGGTLQAWFTDTGIDIKTIGFLALLGQPYAFKFLWAPLFDRYHLPFGGRRRGWIGLAQVLLFASIAAFAFLSPDQTPLFIVLVVLWIAFLSASQDIVIDAYRTDILNQQSEERGLGNALSVTGYRLAMLVSGGLTLIIADAMGWPFAFSILAILMLCSLLVTWKSPEPHPSTSPPKTLSIAVLEPLRDFFKRPLALLIFAFIVLYKLGDAFSGALTTTFLMRGLQASLTEVGVLNKVVSLIASISGLVVGGLWLTKMGLFRALFIFGVLQAVSNLGLMALTYLGKQTMLIAVVLFFENFAGGLGTVALLSFMMSLCNPSFAATQFALLSALTAVGRVYVGPVSGWWVSLVGWAEFYFWTFWLALPGLLALWSLRGYFSRLAPSFSPALQAP